MITVRFLVSASLIAILSLLSVSAQEQNLRNAISRPAKNRNQSDSNTNTSLNSEVKQRENQKGKRVTVSLKDAEPISGSLIQIDADAIQIEVAGNRLRIKMSDVAGIVFPTNATKKVEAPNMPPLPQATSLAGSNPSTISTSTNESLLNGAWDLVIIAPNNETAPASLVLRWENNTLNGSMTALGNTIPLTNINVNANRIFFNLYNLNQGQQQVAGNASAIIEGNQISGTINITTPQQVTFSIKGKRMVPTSSQSAVSNNGAPPIAIGNGTLTISAMSH